MAVSRLIDDLSKISIDSPRRIVHLDVTRTRDAHTPAVSESERQQIKADILARDNYTCSSCGYSPPDSARRAWKVVHEDDDASNNRPSNLRPLCPPCEAIRHCDLPGRNGYLTLRSSDLDQLEIIKRTREALERSGTIPLVTELDPHAIHPDISIVDFAGLLMEKKWDDLPEKYQKYKGFFTDRADKLFLAKKSSFEDPFHSDSNVRAKQIRNLASSLPSVTFSPEEHISLPKFLNDWLPSATRLSEYAWICVSTRNSSSNNQVGPSDVTGLISAWDESCAEQCASEKKLDILARRYQVLSGEWLIFATRDEVDALWSKIARSTYAGTLGISAQVAPRDESSDEGRQVIRVFTKDYTDSNNVKQVRESLRRLGIKYKIGYKPNAFTHCAIYAGNPWGIRPSKYQM